VLTTPALALLKQTRPDLEIGVMVEERFGEIFAGNPTVSQIIAPTWQALRRWRPTLCVNLHGGTRSQVMTALSGARWRAGFSHHSTTLAYNVRIPRAQRILGVHRRVHTAEQIASAFFALGVPLQLVPRGQLFASEISMVERHAVLHPFASSPERQWPPERFAEVARYLQLWNISPIFIAGPNDDSSPFGCHAVLKGTLEQVKGLLANAALFIGNDSGPAHMAAAFGVPTLVLFSTSDAAIRGPWQTESEIVVTRDGLQNLTVSRVIAALERLTFSEAHA
jgi:ADP-heptose:LPS heptosyltransferase